MREPRHLTGLHCAQCMHAISHSLSTITICISHVLLSSTSVRTAYCFHFCPADFHRRPYGVVSGLSFSVG